MKTSRTQKPTIAFVGAGALAAGLARALKIHGYKIDELIVRNKTAQARNLAAELGAKLATVSDAAFTADLVWLAVSDAAIANCAADLARMHDFRGKDWRGKIVLHSSGALSSDLLLPLKKQGAATGSLHPMMTFVRASRIERNSLRGVSYAVEGQPRAVTAATKIARDLEGEVLKLNPNRKAAYHAFGAFLSPLLIAELTAAEQVAAKAGITSAQAKKIMRPIVQRTLSNYLENGAQKAFSGPLIRGDVDTIRRHIASLDGQLLEAYRALARLAISKLKVKNRRELEDALS